MRLMLLGAMLCAASPALAVEDCAVAPTPMTEAWVKQCERVYRDPLPKCHRVDRAAPLRPVAERDACLAIIDKINDWYRPQNKAK